MPPDVERHIVVLHRIVPLFAFALTAAACTTTTSEPATSATATSAASASDVAPTTATEGVESSTTTPSTLAGVTTSDDLPGDLPAVTGAWGTDWSQSTIDYHELKIGIFASDPRDAIAPIDAPTFEPIEAGAAWLGEREPGVIVQGPESVRFYPLSILTLHEIVNDDLDGIPIAITYCPLCNTAVVFDRRLDGDTLRLGVSGLLRNSDLVMWDDLTHSLWQQITGEGIVGTHAGRQLTHVPSVLASFSDFSESFPDGTVMSRDTGFGYPYGVNPYEFYSTRTRPFNFFDGELDERFPALERVIGVTLDAGTKAYPFSSIAPLGALNDVIGGEPVVVLWGGDTADALDRSSIADSRAVGTGVAYSPVVGGDILTFSPVSDSTFVDDQTGSTWTILGQAVDGPLAGSQLTPVVHRNEFWFAWAAFFPDADVYDG